MAAIKREHPDLRVVGELFDADPALVSFYQGGAPRFDGIDSGIDTLFDFPLYFALREAFAKTGSLRDVAKALARDHLYPDAAPLVTFLGLHDVPRFMSEPGASLDGLRAAFTFLATTRGSSTTATRSRCRAGATPTTGGTSRAGGARTRAAPSRGPGGRRRRSRSTPTCGRSCASGSRPPPCGGGGW
jgi:hypothetical protein